MGVQGCVCVCSCMRLTGHLQYVLAWTCTVCEEKQYKNGIKDVTQTASSKLSAGDKDKGSSGHERKMMLCLKFVLWIPLLICCNYNLINWDGNSLNRVRENIWTQQKGNHWSAFCFLSLILKQIYQASVLTWIALINFLCPHVSNPLMHSHSLRLLLHLARTTQNGIISLSLKSIWLIKVGLWIWHSATVLLVEKTVINMQNRL